MSMLPKFSLPTLMYGTWILLPVYLLQSRPIHLRDRDHFHFVFAVHLCARNQLRRRVASNKNQVRRSVSSIQTSIKLAVAMSRYSSQTLFDSRRRSARVLLSSS